MPRRRPALTCWTTLRLYFVTLLYNYYLYTGDKGFLTEEWPVLEKELAYLASLVDATHHVIPGGIGPAKEGAAGRTWLQNLGH